MEEAKSGKSRYLEVISQGLEGNLSWELQTLGADDSCGFAGKNVLRRALLNERAPRAKRPHVTTRRPMG